MNAAVRVLDLDKRFGRVAALDRVSFEVPRGSLFGLLGPNGAGKTTLFSVTAGFLRASGGTVEVLGTDVRQISELRGRLAMLPQDAALSKDVPVLEQLVLLARLEGKPPAAAEYAARQALDFVGLGSVAGRSAGALSHGMAKRVAVCQTVLGSPEVIFLDEPTSGLDPENARALRDLVRRLRSEGRTVVLSSHNLNEVEELCDELAILHRGRLLERASMADLTGAGRHVRLGFGRPVKDEDQAALAALPEVAAVRRSDDAEIVVDLADIDADTAYDAVYRCLGDRGMWPRRVDEGERLEDRFLELTGGE